MWTAWIRYWVKNQRNKMFWDIYREATVKALDSLQDDLLLVMEPRTLYDQGWNDAMKSVARSLKTYKRAGLAK